MERMVYRFRRHPFVSTMGCRSAARSPTHCQKLDTDNPWNGLDPWAWWVVIIVGEFACYHDNERFVPKRIAICICLSTYCIYLDRVKTLKKRKRKKGKRQVVPRKATIELRPYSMYITLRQTTKLRPMTGPGVCLEPRILDEQNGQNCTAPCRARRVVF